MLFALDYDGTFTADPELWLNFVKQAQERGHQVICVTMRYPHEDAIDPRLKELIEIVYTSRKAKKKFTKMQGILPNVWIDDNPDWLYEDAL